MAWPKGKKHSTDTKRLVGAKVKLTKNTENVPAAELEGTAATPEALRKKLEVLKSEVTVRKRIQARVKRKIMWEGTEGTEVSVEELKALVLLPYAEQALKDLESEVERKERDRSQAAYRKQQAELQREREAREAEAREIARENEAATEYLNSRWPWKGVGLVHLPSAEDIVKKAPPGIRHAIQRKTTLLWDANRVQVHIMPKGHQMVGGMGPSLYHEMDSEEEAGWWDMILANEESEREAREREDQWGVGVGSSNGIISHHRH